MWRTALPLLVGLSPAVVFLLQLPDYTATQEGPWQDYKHGRQGLDSPGKKPFCSWKCLLFTLQWPGAFCQVGSITTTKGQIVYRSIRGAAGVFMVSSWWSHDVLNGGLMFSVSSCSLWTKRLSARFLRVSTTGRSTVFGESVFTL